MNQATPASGTFIQVEAGQGHTCGVRSEGIAACWGLNSTNQATPLLGTFTQLSAGDEHTCVLRGVGTPPVGGTTAMASPRLAPARSPTSAPETASPVA